MNIKDFEDTYGKMVDEQLLDLTVQLEDLVPEARQVLAAELQRRGKSQSEIEQYVIAKKKGLLKDKAEPWSPVCNDLPDEEIGSDGEKQEVASFMRAGPVPSDWVRVPSFGMDESFYVAQCMEQYCIPYQLIQGQGGCRQQYHLAVAKENLNDCVEALKEHFGLTDEAAEPFTGECPACGVNLNSAPICTECGLNFCQDQWEARSKHPFTQFLITNNFGRKATGK